VLFQNYPNPFKPNTTIPFELHTGGDVLLTIHDVNGRRILALRSGPFPAGVHRAEWNGCNDNGEAVASGVYFYTLQTGSFTSTKKMVLVR
jgi:flagellar hook assembly protein FlgD